MPGWPRRGEERMGNQPDPVQPVAEGYLPEEGISEYTDYERSNIQRPEEQVNYRPQQLQLPSKINNPLKSKLQY